VKFLQASSGSVEEVELIVLTVHAIALLGHVVVAESDGGLGQLREALLVLKLLGGLES